MRRTAVVAALLLVAWGCGENDNGVAPPAAGITVRPGQSIRAAIEAAPPDTAIYVQPGTYHEAATAKSALVVSKDGIQLVGQGSAGNPVILENSGGQQYGIWVSPADSVDVDDHEHPPCGTRSEFVHNFTLKGFTLQGFDQFGIYLGCNDGYTLAQNLSDGNKVYGLFPVRSQNGTLSDNEARNTGLDAAIYVGQSTGITITGNVAHDSLIGIEIENSSNVTETNNQAFGNTIGLLIDVLPGLQKKDQANVVVSNNVVHDNNRMNTANPDDITAAIPQGTGVLVLAGTTTTVENNTVTDNNFAGIAVASYCTGAALLNQNCTGLDINPNPETVHIVNNAVQGNGTSPPADFAYSALAGDLLWDQTGHNNCWSGNTPGASEKTLIGVPLPKCS